MIEIQNADMREYTSFKAGGTARRLVICDDRQELSEVLQELSAGSMPFVLLGNGSNTLFTDAGYSGTVIRLGKEFAGITIDGTEVCCGSDVLLSGAARQIMEAELTGFEFASGIPGSVGGALFMNAGAYGGEMKDIVKCAEVMSRDGQTIRIVPAEEMDLSYRHSAFQSSGEIILSVTYTLEKGNREEISGTMKELTQRRNEKQPVRYPSAGSTFKRPEGYFAGKLIQDAGLKGMAVGGAQVSELHAGFIINRGGATATDIIQLMRLVQNTVYDQFGVRLEPEVRIIGD